MKILKDNGEMIGEIIGNSVSFTNTSIFNPKIYGMDDSTIEFLKSYNVKTCYMKDKKTEEEFDFPFSYWTSDLFSFKPTPDMNLKMNQRLIAIKTLREVKNNKSLDSFQKSEHKIEHRQEVKKEERPEQAIVVSSSESLEVTRNTKGYNYVVKILSTDVKRMKELTGELNKLYPENNGK